MKTRNKTFGAFPANGLRRLTWCSLLLFSPAMAAPVAPQPVKLVLVANAHPQGDGATAEVVVSLRDAANRPATTPRDVTVNIEARELSGVQHLQVIIKTGANSGRASFPLHEGGIIEFWASHPELRPDTTFVRLKPFARSAGQPAPGYTPRPASPTSAGSDTRVGKEVNKVTQTTRDFGNAAQGLQDTMRQFGSLFGSMKSGTAQPAILAGSQGRRYLADNTDAASIQIFLGEAVSKKTEISLISSGGKLDPAIIIIEAGQETGSTRLISDKIGSVEVKFAKSQPKIKLAPTNTLNFSFMPPIVRLAVRASPPRITLLDTAELLVQLQDAQGKTVATDEPRPVSAAIVDGSAEVQPQNHVIPAGEFEARLAIRPTLCGTIRVKASAANLPDEVGEVRVGLPTMLLSVSAVGGGLGGLLAAFNK